MSPDACAQAVAASGDLSVVRPPEGDSEVEDWVVVYDYPSATEVAPGLQEQAAQQVRRRLLGASAGHADEYVQLVPALVRACIHTYLCTHLSICL